MISIKAIAGTLEASRSNLVEQSVDQGPKRGRYSKADDDRLMPLIRAIVDERPTYGDLHVTALLNRNLRNLGETGVNHKRIYRIMHRAACSCSIYRPRIDRAHDGLVTMLRSNSRWCSDGFEILCRNHEAVLVAFIMDTCDREVIAWAASRKVFSGEMIGDIFLSPWNGVSALTAHHTALNASPITAADTPPSKPLILP